MNAPRAFFATTRAVALLASSRTLRPRTRVRTARLLTQNLANAWWPKSRNKKRIIAAHKRAAALFNNNFFKNARCLERAIALCADLESAGEDPILRFGIKRDGSFEAHAWVELDGVALLENEAHLAQFEPFERELAERWFSEARNR